MSVKLEELPNGSQLVRKKKNSSIYELDACISYGYNSLILCLLSSFPEYMQQVDHGAESSFRSKSLSR